MNLKCEYHEPQRVVMGYGPVSYGAENHKKLEPGWKNKKKSMGNTNRECECHEPQRVVMGYGPVPYGEETHKKIKPGWQKLKKTWGIRIGSVSAIRECPPLCTPLCAPFIYTPPIHAPIHTPMHTHTEWNLEVCTSIHTQTNTWLDENKRIMIFAQKTENKHQKPHDHFVFVLGPDKDNKLKKITIATCGLKLQKMKITKEWWNCGRVGNHSLDVQKHFLDVFGPKQGQHIGETTKSSSIIKTPWKWKWQKKSIFLGAVESATTTIVLCCWWKQIVCWSCSCVGHDDSPRLISGKRSPELCNWFERTWKCKLMKSQKQIIR